LKNGTPLGPGAHGAPLHKIGIVTGLRAERKLALELSPSAVAGGGQPEGARAAAEHLIANGAKALLSFGLAGGLDPACRPGHLAIPRRVVSGIGTWATDPTLTTACGGATIDTLYAGQAIAATASQKAELHHLTGAAAIDLESGEVAAAAARHNLPFAVLRAICDPAERDLPPAALAALDSSGIISIGRVLLSLLRQPSQLPLLLALSHDAAAARAALKRRAEEQGKIRHA
jgi:adenosylhomocysteine nucleosidase